MHGAKLPALRSYLLQLDTSEEETGTFPILRQLWRFLTRLVLAIFPGLVTLQIDLTYAYAQNTSHSTQKLFDANISDSVPIDTSSSNEYPSSEACVLCSGRK